MLLLLLLALALALAHAYAQILTLGHLYAMGEAAADVLVVDYRGSAAAESYRLVEAVERPKEAVSLSLLALCQAPRPRRTVVERNALGKPRRRRRQRVLEALGARYSLGKDRHDGQRFDRGQVRRAVVDLGLVVQGVLEVVPGLASGRLEGLGRLVGERGSAPRSQHGVQQGIPRVHGRGRIYSVCRELSLELGSVQYWKDGLHGRKVGVHVFGDVRGQDGLQARGRARRRARSPGYTLWLTEMAENAISYVQDCAAEGVRTLDMVPYPFQSQVGDG